MRTESGEHDIIVQTGRGKASVEVKNLKKPVSAAMVTKFATKVSKDRNLVKRGIFVSKSGYTPEARKVAKKRGIKLMDYKPPKKKPSSFW
jgi:RecB family endonuclease NucS